MTNILIATDFSFNAYNAVFHAGQILNGRPSVFHLLNVYDEHTTLQSKSVGKNLMQHLADKSNEGLQHTYHRIKLDDPDPNHVFETVSKKGDLEGVIIKTVQEKKIDLVVMGNSGCSEMEAIFLGSNVLRIIRGLKKCPVLTIPKEINFKPPKEIALVTDYKSTYNRELLEPLFLIAKKFESKIRVMHINEEENLSQKQRINRDILLEYLSDFKYSLNWMPFFKSKATTIHDFLEEWNIDMLTMINYQHSFLDRVRREPVIERIAFDLDIPNDHYHFKIPLFAIILCDNLK